MNARAVLGRAPAKAPPRLVLAEDSATLRAIVREMLAPVVGEITEAADGRALFWTLEELLSRKRLRADEVVVVADARMPVYDAIDVLEAWRAADVALVPFVAFATAPDALLRARVLRAGGLFLEEPFTGRALREAVRAATS